MDETNGTGTTDPTDVINRAIAAARAGDLDTLRGLVDWPLTGAGQITSAMPGVDEEDRATAATSGLAELDAAATDPTVVEDILRPLAARLVLARQVRAAEPEVAAAALTALRIGPVEPGLTPDQEARLAELRDRAAALTEVYVVAGDGGELPIVRAGDIDRLVLVLDALD